MELESTNKLILDHRYVGYGYQRQHSNLLVAKDSPLIKLLCGIWKGKDKWIFMGIRIGSCIVL